MTTDTDPRIITYILFVADVFARGQATDETPQSPREETLEATDRLLSPWAPPLPALG